MRTEDAFHPIEHASSDANPLSGFEKWTGEEPVALLHHGADLFDFVIGNRRELVPLPHKLSTPGVFSTLRRVAGSGRMRTKR